MRSVIILAAMVALAGCTNTPQNAEAPAHEPGKAVAFRSNNDAEYREATQRAQEWCSEVYDEPAKYLSHRTDAAGNVVTFGCAPN